MKHYLYILYIVSILAGIQACAGGDELEARLQEADACMSSHPETALTMLDSIDTEHISSKRLKARYALLYSIALDKNYIDVTNDSIIAPAVKYYRNHGTPDEKLKTNYYWGRIAMNSGEYEDATSRFIIAERYVNDATDNAAIGRLYKAQTTVYRYSYDTDGMIEAIDKSAELYSTVKDTTKYINAIFDATAAYLNREDTISAGKSLSLIKNYWDSMTERQKSSYYANLLILNGHTSHSSLPEILNTYETEISAPFIQWLAVAKSNHLCGNQQRALEALKNYDYYGGRQNDIYFWVCGLVYEASGYEAEAMTCYKKYIEITDNKLGYLLGADIRFIKERYETQIKITRKNYILAILALCVIIFFLSSLLITNRIKRIKREKATAEKKMRIEIDKYSSMYNAALAEIGNLNEALENNTLDKTVKMHVCERLGLLNKFIASNITPNFSKNAAQELKQLMYDKKYFIDSTRISFLIEYPKFIKQLKKSGLSDSEIGYCCLYAMGLKGKDISSYLGNGHYKLSSTIRKKLGLTEHDTNLDIYLREILAKTAN